MVLIVIVMVILSMFYLNEEWFPWYALITVFVFSISAIVMMAHISTYSATVTGFKDRNKATRVMGQKTNTYTD